MRLAWILALLLAFGAAERASAQEPARTVVVIVQQERDETVAQRIRGQTADLGAQVVESRTSELGTILRDRLATADRLASEHRANSVLWVDSERHALVIAVYPSRRVVVREIDVSTENQSAMAETVAIVVREVLRALSSDLPLGDSRAAVLAAEEAPLVPGPQLLVWTPWLSAGWEIVGTGGGTDFMQGPSAQIGVSVGRLSVGAEGMYGLARNADVGAAQIRLRRHALDGFARFALVATPMLALDASVHGGAVVIMRHTLDPDSQRVEPTDSSRRWFAVAGLGTRLAYWPVDWAGISLDGAVDVFLRQPAFAVTQLRNVSEQRLLWRGQPRGMLAVTFRLP